MIRKITEIASQSLGFFDKIKNSAIGAFGKNKINFLEMPAKRTWSVQNILRKVDSQNYPKGEYYAISSSCRNAMGRRRER